MDGSDATVNMTGNTTGFGVHLGLNYDINDQLNIGLSYRSKINMEIDKGDANFNVPTGLSSQFPAQNSFSTSLKS